MNNTDDYTRASSSGARYDQLAREINAALAAGDLPRAAALAEQALALGPENPQLLSLAGFHRLNRGDAAGAAGLLERAQERAPRDIHVLNALGIALRQDKRPHDAIAALDAAIAIDPKFATAHFNRGTVFEDLGAFEEARRAYEAAASVQPDHSDALSRLSYLAAVRGDHEEALALGNRAVASRPPGAANDPVRRAQGELQVITVARAEIEAARFLDVLKRLEAIKETASDQTRYSVLGLIGDCHHGLGNASAAFEYFSRAKSEQRRLFAPAFQRPDVEPFLARTARIAEFVAQNSKPWRGKTGGPQPVRTHAFLVGFPRSGTTLLEAALAGHPEIVTVDEEDTLDEAVIAYIKNKSGLPRLIDADDRALAPFREAYWRTCRRFAPALDGKVLVDKVPLNTVYLGLIARLFPDARIIFAIRDPRDVVFSCFRHLFALNIAMFEFATLDGAARLYDAVMRLAGLYRERLDLAVHDYRYEPAIADFEGSMRGVCEFLGVGWSDDVLAFQSTARARPLNTPSATQVARGLYDGAGQWKPYADKLAGVMPLLTSWVSRFGYEM